MTPKSVRGWCTRKPRGLLLYLSVLAQDIPMVGKKVKRSRLPAGALERREVLKCDR